VNAITVLKLGGSLAFSRALPAWLAAIEAGAGKTVLVAGGGPFADAVRSAQPRMGFDDRAGDAMALLAMEQYAIALAALSDHLTVAGSFAAIGAALVAGKVPVWAPGRMVQRARLAVSPRVHDEIPASWDVTSDSLAAWLAKKLCAHRLLLIKLRVEKEVTARIPITAEGLARLGVVDRAFPRFLAEAHELASFWLGPHHRGTLAQALRDGTPIGSRIGLLAEARPIHHAGRAGEGPRSCACPPGRRTRTYP
jgi:dihydroneopterin aldolase